MVGLLSMRKQATGMQRASPPALDMLMISARYVVQLWRSVPAGKLFNRVYAARV
jgi:hypothetical protein